MSDKEQEPKEVKKCLICKPAGDLSTEEIPYWSKKEGNYSPYPKMITCDAKYALEQREDMVEETPPITGKEIQLDMDFGESVNERWVFYFASNPQEDPLTINPPKEAYGQDENHGLAKTDKNGKVSFKLNCPQPYRVEDITYCRHVHYLVEEEGVWSNMRTTRVICEIELEELDKVLKDKTALVINALDFKDFDKDKIPGSINLPAKSLDKLDSETKLEKVVDFLKENISKMKPLEEKVKSKKLDIKDVPIVTYCANKKCKASEKLIDHLYECNVNNVLEWSLGVEGWQKERAFFVDSDEEQSESEEEEESKEPEEEAEEEEEQSESQEEEKSDTEESKKDSDSSSSDSDSSSSSDSDSDSDEDETIEVEYQGVTYLYDIKRKELCDEEADIVAKADYKDGEITNVKWEPGEEKKHKENSDYEAPEEEQSEPVEEEEEEQSESQEEEEPVEGPEEEPEQSEEEEPEEEPEQSESQGEPEEEPEVPSEKFNYTDEKLRVKTVKQLKDLVIKMTERKGGTYSFPLGRKGYRTKGQIIELIQTCQGKPNSKDKKFNYLDEDTLYSLRLNELKSHVEDMITRDEGSYKFALSGFKKNDLIELILACQGDSVQKGGGKRSFKGHGWGFSF